MTEPAIVTYEAIGVVRSPFTTVDGMPLQPVAAPDVRGQIELYPEHRAALQDLDGFSHLWVVSHLHRGRPATGPLVRPFLDDVERGLLATRSPRHPNPIGLSVVRLLGIEGATLEVGGLDLLDGTPVLDLKPYVPLFDSVDAERVGWLTDRAESVHSVRADRRFERPSVRDVMLADPKTLPHDATVGAVRASFENRSLRLALLVRDGRCTGTINRTDIPAAVPDDDAAAPFARAPLTIAAEASVADAYRRLGEAADRRLVVLDDGGRLLGLVCLNRAANGFCRSGGAAAKKTSWRIVHADEPGREQGVLVAAGGKAIAVGDLLTLPPDTGTRWLVLDVRDEREGGIAVVEALSRDEA